MATKSEARQAAESKLRAVHEIDLDALWPDQQEIAKRASECEAYMVLAGRVHVVAVFPASRRAAVATNGDSEWTDLDAERGPEAAREAVARYLAGEMCL